MKRSLLVFAGMLFITVGVGMQSAIGQENPDRLIKQLEEDSDRFSNSTTKALDSSKFDGTPTEDQLIRYVRDFEDSIDRLKDAWEKGQNATTLAKEVQTRAKAIDKFLKKHALGGSVDTDWETVRAVLIRIRNTKMVKVT